MNGSMRVYSFVAQSTIKSFSDEVKEFFDYLESNQDFPSDSQYLIGKAKHISCFARLMLACSLKMLTNPSLSVWHGSDHRRASHHDGFTILGEYRLSK